MKAYDINGSQLMEIFHSGKTESQKRLLADLYFGIGLEELSDIYYITMKRNLAFGKDINGKTMRNKLLLMSLSNRTDPDGGMEIYADVRVNYFNLDDFAPYGGIPGIALPEIQAPAVNMLHHLRYFTPVEPQTIIKITFFPYESGVKLL